MSQETMAIMGLDASEPNFIQIIVNSITKAKQKTKLIEAYSQPPPTTTPPPPNQLGWPTQR